MSGQANTRSTIQHLDKNHKVLKADGAKYDLYFAEIVASFARGSRGDTRSGLRRQWRGDVVRPASII